MIDTVVNIELERDANYRRAHPFAFRLARHSVITMSDRSLALTETLSKGEETANELKKARTQARAFLAIGVPCIIVNCKARGLDNPILRCFSGPARRPRPGEPASHDFAIIAMRRELQANRRKGLDWIAQFHTHLTLRATFLHARNEILKK